MKWNGKQETENMPNIYNHVYFVTKHKTLNTDAVCAVHINNYMMILQFPLTQNHLFYKQYINLITIC